MTTTTTLTPADELSELLLAPGPSAALWGAVDSGRMAELVPELPALRMEQDPIHRHKDVLAHTLAVVDKTSPDLVLRLSALFHDIGKPRTRSFEHGGVTFRHHEAVGARMTRKRLRAMGYPDDVVADVTELVRLSGRFKGYAEGWSDSAVRRYARNAGPLLGTLNELVRCDCTTRNRAKAANLQRDIDDLERRIKWLAEEDRRAAERPGLDGTQVMEHLGLPPGPEVGQALAHLLELKRAAGDLPRDELLRRLEAWWEARRPKG
jgi:poly(A) polymerase